MTRVVALSGGIGTGKTTVGRMFEKLGAVVVCADEITHELQAPGSPLVEATGGVISMAHAMDLRVVAEGVETLEQRSFLTHEGCDEEQGYLTSKPVPAGEFECIRHSIKSSLLADRMRLRTGEFVRRLLLHVLPPSRQIALQSPAGQWTVSTASDITVCWLLHSARSISPRPAS